MTRTSSRTLAAIAATAVLSLVVAACSGADATPSPTAIPSQVASLAPGGIPAGCPTAQPPALGVDETRTVTLATDKGDIVITVDGGLAPIATGNFVALAECGYYDGVVFHRLVPQFVIQGGDGVYGRQPNVDFNRVGTGGPGYTIQDEVVTVAYKRGTVAMARTPQPNSQGSQFFIVLTDQAGRGLAQTNTYAIMGEVTSGMEVVDEIAGMPNLGENAGNLAMTPVSFEMTVATP